MKKFLIIICLFAGLTSCHHDDDDTPVDQTASRTVLIYMAAENNLKNFVTDDLNEMKWASLQLAEDQNLLVYIDKAGSTTNPYLARVKDGELVDTVFMKKSIAADPTTLQYMIQYAREKYPAKSYGLVLWGHASGWLVNKSDTISPSYSRSLKFSQRAYGGSSGDGSTSMKYWMNIIPMAKAIAAGIGSTPLKFIIGDCCNLGCLEVAYELRNVCEYFIGSPAEIPDNGAPYDQIVLDLFVETDNFAKQIIDNYYETYLQIIKEEPYTYYNKHSGDLEGYSIPFAVYKSSELNNFAAATAKILSTIPDKLQAPGALNFDNTIFYAMQGNRPLAYDLKQVLKNNTAAADYTAWLPALEKAIPYHRFSLRWLTNISNLSTAMQNFSANEEDCSSVCMFFPNDIYIGTSPNWNQAILQYQLNDVITWQQYGWQ